MALHFFCILLKIVNIFLVNVLTYLSFLIPEIDTNVTAIRGFKLQNVSASYFCISSHYKDESQRKPWASLDTLTSWIIRGCKSIAIHKSIYKQKGDETQPILMNIGSISIMPYYTNFIQHCLNHSCWSSTMQNTVFRIMIFIIKTGFKTYYKDWEPRQTHRPREFHLYIT